LGEADRLARLLDRCRDYSDGQDLGEREKQFPTGERHDNLVSLILAPIRSQYSLDGVVRYEFAADLVRGRNVVDCACGAG